MKKERLITAEINDNENLAKLNIDDMIGTIQDGLDKVNTMFDTNIRVSLNPLLEQQSEDVSEKEPEEQSEDASEEEPEEQSEDASEEEPEEQSEDTSEEEPEEQQPDIEINITLQDESTADIEINTDGGDSDAEKMV